MFLKNYDNLCVIRELALGKGSNIPESLSVTSVWQGFTTTYLTSAQFSLFDFYEGANDHNSSVAGSSNTNNSGGNRTNLIVGSGDKAVSYDDTLLNSIISTNDLKYLSHVLGDVTYDETTQAYTREYTKIFTALNDVTIKEMGITVGLYNGQGYEHDFLVYREVLETPIEVPTGSNVVITFKMDIGANPNKPAETTISVE